MKIKKDAFRRARLALAATVVAALGLSPLLLGVASAAGQVQTRSIEMSDSTPSQTGVSYLVGFTPATGTVHSLVIDFCSNSSIIGGACTAPAGMDANTSIAVTGAPSGWAIDTTSPAGASTVLLKDSAGTNNLGTSAVTFTLTGIVNPSATGSFWARIYTYTNNSYGTYNNPDASVSGGPGNYVDYGGFALSTVSLINISATVMETLTFCVSGGAPSNGCTSLTAANLTLGHGTPLILDSTQVDTANAFTQISTNALTGAVVRMKTHNTCSGLSRDGGTTCPIPGVGAFGTIGAATADFGLNVANGTGGTGTVNANANYGTTSGSYGMGANVTSTYGDAIEDTNTTACANVNSQLTFAAQANVTTPAGVYSANESLIATGTF